MEVHIFILFFTVVFAENTTIFDDDREDHRIVGGDNVATGEHPWFVYVMNFQNDFFCGGSIVDRTWIVTAAHCFKKMFPNYVLAGTNRYNSGGKKYYARRVFTHPSYQPSTFANDIALIQLKESITYSENVKRIVIKENFVPDGTKVTVVGHGYTSSSGNIPKYLQQLVTKIYNQLLCMEDWKDKAKIPAKTCCTYTRRGQGNCFGDSGGPLIHDDKLLGVVSQGIPCAVGYPDIYTRAPDFKPWIKETIEKYS